MPTLKKPAMEIGCSFTKNCVYMQICAEMHLGLATTLAMSILFSM